MLKRTCANSISKFIFIISTRFFASGEKTWGQNWEYRDKRYCKLVVVFLVSEFDQETVTKDTNQPTNLIHTGSNKLCITK